MKNLFFIYSFIIFFGAFALNSQIVIAQDNFDPKLMFEFSFTHEFQKSDYIVNILPDKATTTGDFIKVFDYSRAGRVSQSIPPDQPISPGQAVVEGASKAHIGSHILISLHEEVEYYDFDELNEIKLQYESDELDSKSAKALLSELKVHVRQVSLGAIIGPQRPFYAGENIIVPKAFQFNSVNRVVKLPDNIKFRNQLVFQDEDAIMKLPLGGSEFIMQLDESKEDRGNDFDRRSSSQWDWSIDRTCHQIDDREYTIEIDAIPGKTCAECVDGALTGQVKVIRSLDGVLDNLFILTDGIDFKGFQTTDYMLNYAGGVNSFGAILDAGMDILIVDWPSPMGYIEYNSQYLEGVLIRLGLEADFESIQALVGISMGGIISRHALINMESQGIPHNVVNWFSGDSPQGGANVSVGVQAMIRELNIMKPGVDELKDMIRIIDSPGARQMLKHHVGLDDYIYLDIMHFPDKKITQDGLVEAKPDFLHLELMDWFDGRYPETTQNNLGIADGSELNVNVVEIGEDILRLYAKLNIFGQDLIITSKASDGVDGNERTILVKEIPTYPVASTRLNTSIGNVDATRGSTLETNRFAFTSNDYQLDFSNDWSYQPVMCALDLGGTLANPDFSDHPWDDFYISKTNDPHTDVTAEKSIWIAEFLDYSGVVPCEVNICKNHHITPDNIWKFNRDFKKRTDDIFDLYSVDYLPDPLPSVVPFSVNINQAYVDILAWEFCSPLPSLPYYVKDFDIKIHNGRIFGSIEPDILDYVIGLPFDPNRGAGNGLLPILVFDQCIEIIRLDCSGDKIKEYITVKFDFSVYVKDRAGDQGCEHGRINCPGDQICLNGECYPTGPCKSDEDCPEGYICSDGKCIPEDQGGCTSDKDCPAGYICVGGECVKSVCRSNFDCPEGYYCSNGVCIRNDNNECKKNSDCPPNHICKDGKCVPVGGKYLATDELNVHPNPATEFITLSGIPEMNNSKFQALVTDGTGRRCLTFNDEQYANRRNIDISALSTGLYYIAIQFENGEIYNQRFIKF